MENLTLTAKEKKVLRVFWNMPLRIKDGNVELKKGNCWGILSNIKDAKENAQILIKRNNL